MPTNNDSGPAYISDDEDDEEEPSHHRARRSKRVMQHQRAHERDKLTHIINLVVQEKATIPDLAINTQRKLTRGWSQANEHLQLGEWAHEMLFACLLYTSPSPRD